MKSVESTDNIDFCRNFCSKDYCLMNYCYFCVRDQYATFSTRKTRVTERIFKLIEIHTSVINQIP